MSNVHTRLKRIAKRIEEENKHADSKKPFVMAVMFERTPPFKLFNAEQRKAALAEAQAKAGPGNTVHVIEWGPRWDAIRETLTAALESERSETTS